VGVQSLNSSGVWLVGLFIIDEPAGGIVVQIGGKDIKKGLDETVSFCFSIILRLAALTVSMLATIGKFLEVSFLVVSKKLTR
jgi:hypothetical protein